MPLGQTMPPRRDAKHLCGALREFRRSGRTRKAATFTRTHAVTLGYLGAVHARRGEIDEACSTWSTALDAMDGIHSARARQTVVDMRAALSAATSSNAASTNSRATAQVASRYDCEDLPVPSPAGA